MKRKREKQFQYKKFTLGRLYHWAIVIFSLLTTTPKKIFPFQNEEMYSTENNSYL